MERLPTQDTKRQIMFAGDIFMVPTQGIGRHILSLLCLTPRPPLRSNCKLGFSRGILQLLLLSGPDYKHAAREEVVLPC